MAADPGGGGGQGRSRTPPPPIELVPILKTSAKCAWPGPITPPPPWNADNVTRECRRGVLVNVQEYRGVFQFFRRADDVTWTVFKGCRRGSRGGQGGLAPPPPHKKLLPQIVRRGSRGAKALLAPGGVQLRPSWPPWTLTKSWIRLWGVCMFVNVPPFRKSCIRAWCGYSLAPDAGARVGLRLTLSIKACIIIWSLLNCYIASPA